MSDDAPLIEGEHAERAWSLLRDDGYFNDESSGLGAAAFRHHFKDVEAALRLLGYDGPELAHNGHHYLDHGAVYWAYNPDRLSYEEARARTDQWVQQQCRR